VKLLVLAREDAEAICKEFEFADQAANVSFLQTVSVFSSWSRSRLMKLLNVMTNRVYPTGELIIRQVRALRGASRRCRARVLCVSRRDPSCGCPSLCMCVCVCVCVCVRATPHATSSC
jgi:hypothetical protein